MVMVGCLLVGEVSRISLFICEQTERLGWQHNSAA